MYGYRKCAERGCERHFIPKSSRNRFCLRHRKTKPIDPEHYGTAHRRLRAQWVSAVDRGGVFGSRCGEPIEPGQTWDLDHVDGGGPRDYLRQDGDRARLLERVAPLKRELRTLLERSARKSTKTKYHRLFANNLLKHWPALWTFAHVEGVEPTNNHAERGLRGAVIYRKLSLGSQSEQGERTIERLLSASVSCRLQRRSLFAYLTDVLSASIRGDPIPALT